MLILLAALACDLSTTLIDRACALGAPTLEPAEADAGGVVRVITTPVTDEADTVVTIGGVRAEVLGVVRDGCDACEDCRETEGCAGCADCDACDDTCATCVEAVRVRVPELEPGTYGVTVTTLFGMTEPAVLAIGGPDTAAP